MSDIVWHIEKRKVKDLIPYKSNPRQISKEQLSHLIISLERFNYAEIIAIQPDNTIIAGHMRYRAMMNLKWGNKEIEVRVPNRTLTEPEMREYLIRSNKNTGEWDEEILANEWCAVDLAAWGFSPEELGGFDEPQEELEQECEKCETCGQTLKKKKRARST